MNSGNISDLTNLTSLLLISVLLIVNMDLNGTPKSVIAPLGNLEHQRACKLT